MKASEARARTKKAETIQNQVYQNKIKEILTYIGEAADKGQYKIIIPEVNKVVETILKSEGYDIKTTYDQRNGDHTEISWAISQQGK